MMRSAAQPLQPPQGLNSRACIGQVVYIHARVTISLLVLGPNECLLSNYER